MKILPLFFCVLALSAPLHAQTDTTAPATAPANPVEQSIVNELVGKWKNALGSTLSIKSIDAQTGKIDGTYISPQGTSGTEYPLFGWVNMLPPNKENDFQTIVISWSVRWGKIGSITAWNGIYAALPMDGEPKTPTIVGNWNLSRPDGDFEWDHVLVGQDRFTKKP